MREKERFKEDNLLKYGVGCLVEVITSNTTSIYVSMIMVLTLNEVQHNDFWNG